MEKKKTIPGTKKNKAATKRPAAGKKTVPKIGFPIIGIGASAGGLEAFELFFKSVPADSGMAYILISHLDPGHASMLTEILQRITSIPVSEAEDQMRVEPDHVYIIPPGVYLSVGNGVLRISPPKARHGAR